MKSPTKFILKTALLVLAIAVVAYLYFLIRVYGVVQGFLLDKAVAAGLSPTVAASVVTFVALALTPLLAGTLIRATMGRFQTRKLLLLAAFALAFFGAYESLTSDWLFDANGRPLSYLCPPSVDQTPRITKWRDTDPYIGTSCLAITRDNAAAVVALRQGREPSKIQLASPLELDSLVTHRYGHPVVFVSDEGDFYSSPGWSEKSPKLLRAVTPEDIRIKRVSLELVEQHRLAKAEVARKAEARAAEAQRRAEKAAAKAVAESERVAAAKQRAADEQAAKLANEAAAAERVAAEKRLAEQHAVADDHRALAEKNAQNRAALHEERLFMQHEQARYLSIAPENGVSRPSWVRGRQVVDEQIMVTRVPVDRARSHNATDNYMNPRFRFDGRPTSPVIVEYGGRGRYPHPPRTASAGRHQR